MQQVFMQKTNRYTLLFFLIYLCSFTTALSQNIVQIQFPNSGKSQAQQAFRQGVLLLHSFEYEDAAEAFRQAQQQDTGFALAYWGEAMTYNHPIWGSPTDREKAIACLNKLAPTQEGRFAKAPTEREKGFLKAVDALYDGSENKQVRDSAYLNAMRQLYIAYPNDLEIASFYALANLGVGIIDTAAAVSQKVLNKNPYHPGALHYFIHCNDNPRDAHLALEAARRYPKAAPYAAHALHMPSHIYAALGMWDGVVASNEQSMKAADARVKRKNLGVDQRGFHSIWWLEYGYLQQGRYKDALTLIKDVEEDASKSDDKFIRNNLAWMRAHYIVETKDWNNPLLDRTIKIADLSTDNQVMVHFTNGYAAIQRNDLATAQKALDSINISVGKTGNIYTDSANVGSCHAMGNAAGKLPVKYSMTAILQKELQALLFLKANNPAACEKNLREAIRIENNKGALTVPIYIKPAHELLGEVLLMQSRPEEAKKEFELALQLAPNRVLSITGLMQAAKQTGDQKQVNETRALLKNIRKHTQM